MLEVATAGESGSRLPSVRVGNAAEVKSIGQVEITDEASLEDLKAQVKNLKGGVHGCLSGAPFTRERWTMSGKSGMRGMSRTSSCRATPGVSRRV